MLPGVGRSGPFRLSAVGVASLRIAHLGAERLWFVLFEVDLAQVLGTGGGLMMTLQTFLDESGKFHNNRIVSFGGMWGPTPSFPAFNQEWHYLLHNAGLEVLEMKRALNSQVPLSATNPALGTENRMQALYPFVACVRKHMPEIVGIAIDVAAFKSLVGDLHKKMFGDDPFYTAFARMVLHILSHTGPEVKAHLICDDEEAIALGMYDLYRKVRNKIPGAREGFQALTFADDRWSMGLQAADMIASLMRQEADRLFFRKEYVYQPLFNAMAAEPKPYEAFKVCGVCFIDEDKLLSLAHAEATSRKLNRDIKRIEKRQTKRAMMAS